jgi:hypothetical protein
VNTNIKRGQNHTNPKWYNRSITLSELKQYYGIIMEIESTYGNDNKNLRKHHQDIKAKYLQKNIKVMGIDRFERIRSSLVPTVFELQKLSNLLGEICKEYKLVNYSNVIGMCLKFLLLLLMKR